MLTYGLESSGDWLQLCAASAWLLANIAAFVQADPDWQVDRALRLGKTRLLRRATLAPIRPMQRLPHLQRLRRRDGV